MVILSAFAAQNLGDFDPAPLARGLDPREQDGERSGRRFAAHLGLRLAARRGRKFLEFLDDGVVFRARHRARALAAALDEPQSLVQVVVRRRLLAVDVHQVVLGGGGVAGIERRQRAVIVLEDEARDVGVFAGQHQLDERAAHRFHRPHQVCEHVGVMDADLQHDASGHARGGVAP